MKKFCTILACLVATGCASRSAFYIKNVTSGRMYGPLVPPSYERTAMEAGQYVVVWSNDVSREEVLVHELLVRSRVPDFSLRQQPIADYIERMRAAIPTENGAPLFEIKMGPTPVPIVPETLTLRLPDVTIQEMLSALDDLSNLKYKIRGRVVTIYTEETEPAAGALHRRNGEAQR